MPDLATLCAILAVGTVAYAMRTGGFLAAGALPQAGLAQRLLRLAPGNLFVAFSVAGIIGGGWPALLGCGAAISAMAATGKEWASLAAGFATAALASALL